jgi:hypothetical protein
MATVKVGLGRDGNQPEQLHVGDNVIICKVSLSVSWSSGDIHVIGKLPNGAIPLDAVFYPGAAAAAGTVAKFGTSASNDLLFASATYSQAAAPVYRLNRKIGTAQQISLSDDARVLYENLTMVATAGVSIGHVGDLVVYYKMPGQTL